MYTTESCIPCEIIEIFKWKLDTTPYQWLCLVNVWPHSLIDLPICLQFFQTFVINCYANIPLKVAILRFKGRICKLYNNGTISKHFLGIFLVLPALPLNFKKMSYIGWAQTSTLQTTLCNLGVSWVKSAVFHQRQVDMKVGKTILFITSVYVLYPFETFFENFGSR